MIKSIKLLNWQSHKDTKLELCDTVNIIEGSSNCGKSAILRALNWVVSNRPTGEAYISSWARNAKGKQIHDTSVTVEFDNTTVTRFRGESGNNYVVDGLTLDAIGTDVPQKVIDACNFTDVNLQAQMDAPFLLSSSGGEVARFFNKIVHLDLIDKFLAGIDSKKRKTKAQLETLKESIEKVSSDLEELAYLDKAEKLISKIEKREGIQEELQEEIKALDKEASLYESFQKYLEEADTIIVASEKLYGKIEALLGTDDTVVQELEQSIKDYISNKSIADNDACNERTDKLVAKIMRYLPLISEGKKDVESLELSIEDYGASKMVVDSFEGAYDALQKSLPKVCPVCGGPL
jgi:exonuclease SbcC